jgi:hypothetical protein
VRSRQCLTRVGSSKAGREVATAAVFDLDSHVRHDVEELREEFGSGHAIDDRVMEFGDQTDLASIEPLDEMHLPGRLIAVKRPLHDLRRHLVQFHLPARVRQGCPMKMVVEINLGRPARVVEAGDFDESAPKGSSAGSRSASRPNSVERVATRCGRRFKDAGAPLHRLDGVSE